MATLAATSRRPRWAAGETFTQQHRVVGDDCPHGSSTCNHALTIWPPTRIEPLTAPIRSSRSSNTSRPRRGSMTQYSAERCLSADVGQAGAAASATAVGGVLDRRRKGYDEHRASRELGGGRLGKGSIAGRRPSVGEHGRSVLSAILRNSSIVKLQIVGQRDRAAGAVVSVWMLPTVGWRMVCRGGHPSAVKPAVAGPRRGCPTRGGVQHARRQSVPATPVVNVLGTQFGQAARAQRQLHRNDRRPPPSRRAVPGGERAPATVKPPAMSGVVASIGRWYGRSSPSASTWMPSSSG